MYEALIRQNLASEEDVDELDALLEVGVPADDKVQTLQAIGGEVSTE